MQMPNDIGSCHALILELQNQNDILRSKLEELEDRLNKNSTNSNKPPSSDGLKKRVKISPAFPRKKGKKSGGQKGHKGKTLELCAVPDITQVLLPQRCACGSILSEQKAEVKEIRQVFDIPSPKLEVTEYQKMGCNCDQCGAYNEGEFPEGVNARVQYGHGVRALVVLLNIAFKLPLKKIQRLFSDLYGYAINENTIIQTTKRCHEYLEQSQKAVKQSIIQSSVVHFDETGIRVEGKLHWLHTACTQLYSYLFVHTKRGKKALLDSDSILPDYKNWAIHDCWSSYFKFTQCMHAICGAHIIRELIALEEKGTQWATWLKRYLYTLYLMSDKGKSKLSLTEQQKALLLFEKIWNYADQAEPPPQKTIGKRGRPKATKGRNLLIRMKKHQTALLAFAFNEEVPFTNNLAERELRPAKTKQKVAGCFRTFKGAQIYARILGFISTTRKHQLNAYEEIKLVFSQNSFLTTQQSA